MVAVASEVFDERLLTVTAICDSIPGARGARRLSPSSVTRWILSGARSITGEVIKLKARRVGYRWLVRPSDLRTFFDTLARTEPETEQPPRTQAARAKSADATVAKLQALGA
jgi:hypothetical protein